MPFMHAIGFCIACGNIFSFNPERVPCIRASRATGKLVVDPSADREPICRNCFERQNAIRREMGNPEVPLLPGAYDPEEIA